MTQPGSILSLLFAILERAILDSRDKDPKFRAPAIRFLYFWSEEDYLEAFSFPWICSALELDPAAVLENIKKLRKNKKLKIKHARFSHLSIGMMLTGESEDICGFTAFQKRWPNMSQFS